MKSLLMLVACLFLLGACSSNLGGSNLPKEIPKDFNFVLNYGYEARDIINTYENTYTKNMISNDDKTVEIKFSDEEMQTIYEEMKEADILNSAESASKSQCADPHEINKLKITMNGEIYQREWITSDCDKVPDNKLKNFVEFVHREIIMIKEEYNELPEPSGGYD